MFAQVLDYHFDAKEALHSYEQICTWVITSYIIFACVYVCMHMFMDGRKTDKSVIKYAWSLKRLFI